MKRFLFKAGLSFRKQLFGIVSLGTLGLALTASVTTAWVTSSKARTQMLAQGHQITANLAEQCILALLYMSSANAEKPLGSIMNYPDVEYAAVFDTSLKTLLAAGSNMAQLPEAEQKVLNLQAPIMLESPSSWKFLSPVFTDTGSIQPENTRFFSHDEKPDGELLGYVLVSMNKRTLGSLQKSIFLSNITIGLSFGCAMLLLVHLGIRHLTKPLYDLSDIMKETQEKGEYRYAALVGPEEISQMAVVFNRMMESISERDTRLRRHQETLQSQVEIRTGELRLARDAALAASRHKSQFLTVITHELRTPLQGIIGYADLVREELLLEGMDQCAGDLDRLINNAQQLLEMINSILNLSKIEAGKMEVKLERVDLNDLVQNAVETVRPLLLSNENLFELSLEAQKLPLHIDKDKLLHCLINLLSNAAKFTSKGNIRLEVRQTTEALDLSVSDTGIGMSAMEQKIIFEEFRQVDGSNTRKVSGTGMGLAITRGFCELMGGRIEVESSPGAGSVFNIHIPLPINIEKIQTQGPAPQQISNPLIPACPGHRGGDLPTVLLVDDDPVYLHSQVLILEKSGYRVFTTPPAKAHTKAKVLKPDVITLEQRPKGIECATLVQSLQSDPDLANIPIVLLVTYRAELNPPAHWQPGVTVQRLEQERLLQAIRSNCAQ